MPLGTGQDVMHNVPATPFTPSPGEFDARTSRTASHQISFPTPGAGNSAMRELPKAGVLTWVRVSFDGTLTSTPGGGSVTAGWRWPYGLLSNLNFSANLQNGLVNASGIDLHVLRFLRNPAFIDATDVFPQVIGGGGTIANGNHHLHLTYDVPVVLDKVTLAGAIYAQSNQNALTLAVSQAPMADLVTLAGGATATLAGDWTFHITSYEIPQDAEKGIIVPDLSRLHAIQARETPFNSVGDAPTNLTQVNGQLVRLLVQVRGTATSWLTPKKSSLTPVLENLRIRYGANQTPLDYVASDLLATNNEHYGAPLPYGYLALDFVKENPIRDAVYMPGLTELQVVPTVGSTATVDANAKVRVVQEMLFQ